MTTPVYETMKHFAVAGACGYFIGMILSAIFIVVTGLVRRIRQKRACKQKADA